jgi:hypothetical protein
MVYSTCINNTMKIISNRNSKWYIVHVSTIHYRQMYLTRLDHVDDDTDDELITNMEPIDVFVNSNEPTFTYGVVKSY